MNASINGNLREGFKCSFISRLQNNHAILNNNNMPYYIISFVIDVRFKKRTGCPRWTAVAWYISKVFTFTRHNIQWPHTSPVIFRQTSFFIFHFFLHFLLYLVERADTKTYPQSENIDLKLTHVDIVRINSVKTFNFSMSVAASIYFTY